MKKSKRLVIVTWLDSVQPSPQWQLVSEFKSNGGIECASVGWLLQDGKKCKALAPNMGGLNGKGSPQVSGVIHIPTCCITSITDLIEV